jgi:hypothetical protein
MAVLCSGFLWTLSHGSIQAQNTPPPQNPANSFPPTTTSVTVDPNLLVLDAVHRSVFGPSFTCQFRQKTHLFERTLTSVGSYVHAGKGTGQFKLLLKSTVGDDVKTTQQTSDGRMLWTSLGPEFSFRTVNLDSVRNAIAKNRKTTKPLPEEALYLAIGGQPELLRSLYIRYRWHKIYAGKLNEQAVWQLVGASRSEPPNVASHTLFDESISSIQGQDFPTEVRLTLQRGEPLDLVPMRVEYFTRTKSADGKSSTLKALSTIEYFGIQGLDRPSIDHFTIRLPEDSRSREDETQRYLPKIQ